MAGEGGGPRGAGQQRTYLDIPLPTGLGIPDSGIRGQFVERKPSTEREQFIQRELENGSTELQEAARKIEEEYTKEAELIVREGAENRLDLLERVLKRVLEAVDLDSREKVLAALAEVIPFVGVLYAVTGRRLAFERSDAGWPLPRLEKIDWTERGLYLIGELIGSGHVVVGVKRFVFKGIASITRRRLAQFGKECEEGLPLVPGVTNLLPENMPKREVEVNPIEVEIT